MDSKIAKKQIKKLIEKYEKLDPAKRKKHNESMTCKDFILPFFQALGWDVYNNKSSDEVLSEKQLSGKRVDYAFNVDGVTKFYLEAKKFDVDLREERWSKQAIMYAWHKSVPWALLTDFESLRVFNAEWDEPNSEQSLVFEIPYKDYLTDERLWLISRESMLVGELDEYAEKNFKKPKREPVDKQLANDLMSWRDILFNNIRAWNYKKKIGDKQLAEVVQKLLNRLIFIRTTEDRKIEGEKLRDIIRSWEEKEYKSGLLTNELQKTFRYYWKNYDSKLFERHLCDALEYKEDSFLAKVITELYKNKRGIRYNFAHINADVLGSIYEQYLGRIQQEDQGKRETKRRSQGIYYTPPYIVDYIVRNTLNSFLKGRTDNKAPRVRILDPACGSGSFLIKAFETLNRYLKRKNWLTNKHRINILTSNIYGVDLDEKAIKIAQLNLLLRALKKRELLPSLYNIRCGNSLLSGTEKSLKERFGKDWKKKKSFNWKERFSKVFKQGGFDIIVGNPPYIKEYVNKAAFDGLRKSLYYQGKMDIWTMFACVAIDLLKEGGSFSFIAPSNWITNKGASIFRDKILKEGEIISLVDFGDYKVFKEAGIQTMIFIFKKCKPRESYGVNYSKIIDKAIKKDDLVRFLKSNCKLKLPQTNTFKAIIKPQNLYGKEINFIRSEQKELLKRIEMSSNFKLTNKEVGQGIVCPQGYVIKKHLKALNNSQMRKGDGIFVLKDYEMKRHNFNKKEKEKIKPYYTPKNIDRFFSNSKNKHWIIYADKDVRNNIKLYPNIKKHLDNFKKIITSDFAPYGLHRSRDQKFFEGEKILSVRKTDIPRFSYNSFSCYVSQTFFIIKTKRINLEYLTGLLNSTLIYFWLKNRGKLQGDMLQIDKEPLLEIPIVEAEDKKKEKEIIGLVRKISAHTRKLKKTDPDLYKEDYREINNKIKKLDKKLDKIVYCLYGVTKKDIRMITGS